MRSRGGEASLQAAHHSCRRPLKRNPLVGCGMTFASSVRLTCAVGFKLELHNIVLQYCTRRRPIAERSLGTVLLYYELLVPKGKFCMVGLLALCQQTRRFT